MGYSMQLLSAEFLMEREQLGAALAAVKALHGREQALVHMAHFAWTNDTNWWESRDLDALLDCWGWTTRRDPAGNIVGISFDREKLGDEELLFNTLAPFVRAGSFIEMAGEEGERWRWYFDGKRCINQRAEFRYEP